MIKAYGKRIIVELLKEEDKTSGGILLPESAKGEQPTKMGKVTSIGHEVPPVIFVGQKVLFGRYAGIPLVEDIISLKEDEILGKYDNSPRIQRFDRYLSAELADITLLKRQHFEGLLQDLFYRDIPTSSQCVGVEEKYGCSPVRDSYLCFVHPDITHFIRAIDGFVDIDDYPSRLILGSSLANSLPCEMGAIGNLRIIETDHKELKMDALEGRGCYRILAMPALFTENPLTLLDRKGAPEKESIIVCQISISYEVSKKKKKKK